MNPQGAMRAVEAQLEAEVDAYVDALLTIVDAGTVGIAPMEAAPPRPAATDAPSPAANAGHAASTAALATPAAPPHVPNSTSLEPAAIRGIAPPVLPPQSAPADEAPTMGTRIAQIASGHRWLRIAIGEDRYAVELLRVQEVVRVVPVIAVRGAVSSLLGVMNLRGRIVPVHDLGKWLRSGQVTPDERARIVVLEHSDELVGLLVTAVTDVVTLDASQVEPPTPGTRDRTGLGIARTPGAPPTVLLDARVVFD